MKYDVSNIPHFYQSLINTLSLFSHKKKVTPPCPVDGIPFEPLWYNSYVTHNRNIITDTVIQQLISLGVTHVKHLCEMKSYERCCLPTPMTLASGGSPMFLLVVHQPASPSIWPAVQSLRRGLSTNPQIL